MWAGEKHPANPLISPDLNPDASSEQYQPAVVLVEGTYHMLVKSDELEGQRRRFRLWQSDDGVSWELEDVTFGPEDSSLDVNELHHPVLVYDRKEELFHLYYRADGGPDDGTIGHAVGDTPYALRDDSSNPVLTNTELEREFGAACCSPQLTDMIEVGEETIYYGFYWTEGWAEPDSGDSHCIVFCAVGERDDLKPRNVITTSDAFPRSGNIIGNVSVFERNGHYCLTAMVGRLLENDVDQRETYAMVGDGFDFVPVAGRVLDTGSSGSWEEKWVYGGSWLKDNHNFDTLRTVDGRHRFYYNGQDRGGNNGSVGLAEFDEIPVLDSLVEINSQAVSVFVDETGDTPSVMLPTDVRAVRPIVAFERMPPENNQESIEVSLSTFDAMGDIRRADVVSIHSDGSGNHTKRGPVVRLESSEVGLRLSPSSGLGFESLRSATLIGYKTLLAPDVR